MTPVFALISPDNACHEVLISERFPRQNRISESGRRQPNGTDLRSPTRQRGGAGNAFPLDSLADAAGYFYQVSAIGRQPVEAPASDPVRAVVQRLGRLTPCRFRKQETLVLSTSKTQVSAHIRD